MLGGFKMEEHVIPVTISSLKEELMGFSKEQLADLVDIWLQMYWVCQSHWVSYVEHDFGVENATRLDGKVFEKSAKIQVRKLKELFHLGGDMQSLAFLMRHCVLQWVSAGFKWEFIEITDKHITLRVRECPMGTFRKSQGLEVFPCRNFATGLYIELAKTLNPKFSCRCLHAHPDPAKEGVMCEWEFFYED
jgi:hypothetical protein